MFTPRKPDTVTFSRGSLTDEPRTALGAAILTGYSEDSMDPNLSPVVRKVAEEGLYYSPLNNDEDVNHNVYTVQHEVEGMTRGVLMIMC